MAQKGSVWSYIGGGYLKIKVMEIKKIMAESGWNNSVLAKESGISRQSISTILARGSCSIPSAGKIARALGVELETIMKEE